VTNFICDLRVADVTASVSGTFGVVIDGLVGDSATVEPELQSRPRGQLARTPEKSLDRQL
jgi:hypothetical protein